MAEVGRVSGGAKYSVVFTYFNRDTLPSEPSPTWKRKDVFVRETDITKIFEGFRMRHGWSEEMTHFTPVGFPEMVVYYNPGDTNSLLILAEEENELKVHEFVRSLGLKLPPRVVPRGKPERGRGYSLI